jgi:hypothetical protein
MYLSQAVDEIRDKLVQHRLAPKTFLWSTIRKQIAKQDAFDEAYVDVILEAIRTFLRPLDDVTILALWRETDVGLVDESRGVHFSPADLRLDVEMDLLEQLTDLACYEATGKWPEPQRSFDEPDCD